FCRVLRRGLHRVFEHCSSTALPRDSRARELVAGSPAEWSKYPAPDRDRSHVKKLILVVAVLVILVWGRQIVGVAIWGAMSAWDSIHPTIRSPPSDKYPFPWLKVHHDADVARSGIPFRDTEEGQVTFFSRVAGRWRKLPAKSGSVWKLDDDHALIVYDDHNKGNHYANYAGSD